MNLGYILKVEIIVCAHGLHVDCEEKRARAE